MARITVSRVSRTKKNGKSKGTKTRRRVTVKSSARSNVRATTRKRKRQ